MNLHTRAVPVFHPHEHVEHIQGPATARITLVAYVDFQCPACAELHAEKNLIRTHFGSQLRIVYRHYPQNQSHPDAELAAEASEAAASQGKFWQFCDLLFENQQHLKEKHLLDYARRLNLDIARYQNEMNDHVYRQRVQEHLQSAQHLGLVSTPAVYINDVFTDVSSGLHHLSESINKALRTH